ncbi:MAG: hypothetical protein AMXMBFR46_28400 [Acidimicrobiia bacterium]
MATVDADRARGAWIDPRDAALTFREVAERWLAANPAKRESTWTADESTLRNHVLPELGAHRIGSITRANLQRLVSTWSETLRPRSVKRVFGTTRAVFNFAVESDFIAKSPCRGVKLPALDAVRVRHLSADDVAVLAETMPPAHRLMVWIGAMTGLRWGEVAALRVGRVDVLGRTLTVVDQVARGRGGVSRIGPPKSRAGVRTLTMPAVLCELVAEHLAARGLTGADADELLFVSDKGGPLDYPNWRRRVWLPACAAAGLDGAGFHDLRRANATALVAGGVDVKTAQARLGHSDPRLTLAVYAQATTEADRAAADVIGERFAGCSRDGAGAGGQERRPRGR